MKRPKGKIVGVILVVCLGVLLYYCFRPSLYWHYTLGRVYVTDNPQGRLNGLRASIPAHRPRLHFRIPRWTNPKRWRPSEEQILQELDARYSSDNYLFIGEEDRREVVRRCVSVSEYAEYRAKHPQYFYRYQGGQVCLVKNSKAAWNGLLTAPAIQFGISIWEDSGQWKPSESQVRESIREWAEENNIGEEEISNIVNGCISIEEFRSQNQPQLPSPK